MHVNTHMHMFGYTCPFTCMKKHSRTGTHPHSAHILTACMFMRVCMHVWVHTHKHTHWHSDFWKSFIIGMLAFRSQFLAFPPGISCLDLQQAVLQSSAVNNTVPVNDTSSKVTSLTASGCRLGGGGHWWKIDLSSSNITVLIYVSKGTELVKANTAMSNVKCDQMLGSHSCQYIYFRKSIYSWREF